MKTVAASSASPNLKAKCAVASAWLIGDGNIYKYVNGDWKEIPNPNSTVNKNYNLLRSKYASSDVFEQFYSECDRFSFYCKKVAM
jgi:hypothetical protein